MSDAAHEFWTRNSDYPSVSRQEELVKEFERNIERTHPKHLSGRSKRDFGWCNCSWCATSVDYYEYRGPDVKNIG